MRMILERIFNGRKPRVLVVGDVMCDVYLLGKVERISPEAPVPIFVKEGQHQVLGGAANVAANLQALGCDVRLMGLVGADGSGRRVRDLLHQRGLDDRWLLEDPGRPTTEKIRLIASQQHLLRLDQENRAFLSPALVVKALDLAGTAMAEIDGIVCSDYAKGVCAPDFLGPLFTLARAARRPIFVDPKVRDFSRYRGATVLTPNMMEFEHASGVTVTDPVSFVAAAEVLQQRSEAAALLVTRGKDGMTLFHPPQTSVSIPSRAREVFDVTGAGDTVIATFSMAVLCGLPFVEAARLANAAAGVVVGKVGTTIVSPEELLIALQE
jgi:D-beta-D-heptose 7-phosphate kinase / D-beta-D-heptose 1-phosphate adenosyltransferase